MFVQEYSRNIKRFFMNEGNNQTKKLSSEIQNIPVYNLILKSTMTSFFLQRKWTEKQRTNYLSIILVLHKILKSWAAEPLAHVQCILPALIIRILIQEKAFQPIANLRFHNQLSSSLTDKKFADSLFGQYFIMK